MFEYIFFNTRDPYESFNIIRKLDLELGYNRPKEAISLIESRKRIPMFVYGVLIGDVSLIIKGITDPTPNASSEGINKLLLPLLLLRQNRI